MAYSRQMRGQGFLLGAVLSRRVAMGSGALLGDMQTPGLDIRGSVWLPRYLCHRVLHRAHCFLPGYVYLTFESITVYMRVSLVEPSFQTMMGWVPALEYMLSGACGLLQSCSILSSYECYRSSRPWHWPCLSCSGSPQVGWLDAWVPPESR
jgi:hypothetical protein